MKTDHERYRELQYKKDTGQAMSGHERMELSYLTELFLLRDKLKTAKEFISQVADKSNWTKAYYGEEYPTTFDYDDAGEVLKKIEVL